MARTVGSIGEKTREAILSAGIDLIHDQGFEAVSLRKLASGVGLQAGSLYNHIASKQDFLFEIMRTVLVDLERELDARLDTSKSPPERLRDFIAFHIDFHIERRKEVFIGNMELRSLTPDNRKVIVKMRRAYEEFLRSILVDGDKAGDWHVEDSQVTTYALIAMLTGVSSWYEEGGRLSKNELIELHANLVFGGLK